MRPASSPAAHMTAIIVGAGQAGAHAALAMRKAGYPSAILLIGAEPERPHERPPFSKAMLTAAEEPALSYFHTEERYAEHSITLMLGTPVSSVDAAARTVTMADGRVLGYDRLLLATGGRARQLTVPGADRVLTMRTAEDARALRQRLRPGARLVCVGAGVIGLEVASSAQARGCAVTVIEPAPRLMNRSLAPALSEWLAARHRAAGVHLRFGIGVTAVAEDHVACTDASAVPADIVIAGIGMERDTALAAQAGLALEDGILVDEFGLTSVPGIYAAGDVAAFWVPRLRRHMRLETWRHAQDHGDAVGRAMAGQCAPYDELPWFWTDQHGANLQVLGACTDAAAAITRGSGESFAAWYLDGAGAVVGVSAVNAPREIRAGRGIINDRRPVNVARLADAGIPAQRLAAVLAADG
jgi:3-phenylpropionate/trans-cinnamate dioxygenase ferredoxin reductase subunit